MSKKNLLFYIILLGLVLRLAGITHGFPFILHPDEPTIVRSALGTRFYANPHHFDWPHLYVYVNYFMYMVFAKLRTIYIDFGALDFMKQWVPLLLDDSVVFYFLSRVLTAILGALSAIPVYLTGRKLLDNQAGIFAALAITILPFAVHHAHYALPDVPMVFLLAWGLYFTSRIVYDEDLKNYLLAGFFIGLSASTKYNGGLGCVSVALVHLVKYKNPLKKIHLLVLSGLACVVGFVVGTPYSILDFDTFSRTDGPAGAFWQFANVGSVGGVDYLKNLAHVLFSQLPENFGYTIFIIYALFVLYTALKLFKKRMVSSDVYLIIPMIVSIFMILYLARFKILRSQYFMITYPFVCVTFGIGLSSLINWMGKKRELLIQLFAIAVFVVPLVLAALDSLKFTQGDTRQLVYYWIQKNVPPGQPVFYRDSSFGPVAARISEPVHKGMGKVTGYHSGYMVVYDDGEFNLRELPTNVKPTLVLDIDNSFKLGPPLIVYKYTL